MHPNKTTSNSPFDRQGANHRAISTTDIRENLAKLQRIIAKLEETANSLEEAEKWQSKALENLQQFRSNTVQAELSQLQQAMECNQNVIAAIKRRIHQHQNKQRHDQQALHQNKTPLVGGALIPKTPSSNFAPSPVKATVQQEKPRSQPIYNMPPGLCRAYNAGVEDSDQKYRFREQYRPIRVGVVNATVRRRDPEILPEFEADEAGDYYAVAIEGKPYYAVLPRHDLTLQEHSYSPGAMGEVFDCPDFNPRLRYRHIRVVQPAVLEPDAAKQRWTLKAKGKLDIGQGE